LKILEFIGYQIRVFRFVVHFRLSLRWYPAIQYSTPPATQGIVRLAERLKTCDRTTENQSCDCQSSSEQHIRLLTVDIALAFVCLSDKQVCHVPANAVLVRHCVSTKDFLEPILRLAGALTEPVQYSRSSVDQSSVTVLPLDHGDHLG